MEVEETMVVSQGGELRRRFAAASFSALAVPVLIGLGALIFFTLPDTVPVWATLVFGGLVAAGAYFAFLRYDFEVSRFIESGQIKSGHPNVAAFRPGTVIFVAECAGIRPRVASACLIAALLILAIGLCWGLVQIVH